MIYKSASTIINGMLYKLVGTYNQSNKIYKKT